MNMFLSNIFVMPKIEIMFEYFSDYVTLLWKTNTATVAFCEN